MWAVILNSQSNQDNFVSRYISVGAWKYFGQCAEILWCAQKYFGVDKTIFFRCKEIFWTVHGNIYLHIYAQHWLFGGRVSIRRETCLLLLTHNQAMPSKDQATPQPQPIQPKTQPIQPETHPIQPETQPIQTETQPKLLFPSNHTTIQPKDQTGSTTTIFSFPIICGPGNSFCWFCAGIPQSLKVAQNHFDWHKPISFSLLF